MSEIKTLFSGTSLTFKVSSDAVCLPHFSVFPLK